MNKAVKEMTNEKELSWLKYTELLFVLVSGIYCIYLSHTTNQENMRNIERVGSIITQYETRLDTLIAGDPELHKKYLVNLRKVTSSLTKEEKELITKLYNVE
jgi:hypothetical protein